MINKLKKILKKNHILYFVIFFIYQKILISLLSKIKNLITSVRNYKKNKIFLLKPKEVSKIILYEKEFFFPKYSVVYKNFLNELKKKKTLELEYNLISKEFFKSNIECIIDVGANIGYQSLFYNNFFGSKTKIYCFEPHPISFSFLKKNLSTYDNIVLNNFALGNENSQDYMSIPNHEVQKLSDLGVMSIGQHSKHFKTKIIIKKFDLLEISLKNFKSIYVKIDVEGYEGNVLKGMSSFLKSDLNIFLKVEFSKHFNDVEKITSTIGVLEKCNYNFYIKESSKFIKMNRREIEMFLIYRNTEVFCKKNN